jgi:hypothetical protein
MPSPSPANLLPQTQIPHSQEVTYGGRPVTVFEQPESVKSFDVAPSDPVFLIQTVDDDDQPHNFYGVPGLGIIDTTRSRTTGELHWAAIFNPNNPNPVSHSYGIPIAGPNPDSKSTRWMPYDRAEGGLSQSEAGFPDLTGFRVKRVAVDSSRTAGGDVGRRPSRSETDPFQAAREALNGVPGASDALNRWEQIRHIYPDMRALGQTALVKMVAHRQGRNEEDVARLIQDTGFY